MERSGIGLPPRDADGLAAQLTPRLRPGERLLWCGRPDPDVHLAPGDRYLIPFSIVWFALTLGWGSAAQSAGHDLFAILWGLGFALLGVYFTVGRFLVKQTRKLRTAYGVTNQRIMITVGASTFIDSPVRDVATSIAHSGDGRHVSITFGNTPWPPFAMYANTGMEYFSHAGTLLAFFDVADPATLLSALDEARRA